MTFPMCPTCKTLALRDYQGRSQNHQEHSKSLNMCYPPGSGPGSSGRGRGVLMEPEGQMRAGEDYATSPQGMTPEGPLALPNLLVSSTSQKDSAASRKSNAHTPTGQQPCCGHSLTSHELNKAGGPVEIHNIHSSSSIAPLDLPSCFENPNPLAHLPENLGIHVSQWGLGHREAGDHTGPGGSELHQMLKFLGA